MSDWFTSDTHASHFNIIRYSHRPFASVSEMNKALADNINKNVSRRDTLHHLGDWSFGGLKEAVEFREMINCNNIRLIVGNHDERNLRDGRFEILFSSVHDLETIRSEGKTIVLCHYAMRVWNKSHHGVWHLYGHSHGTLPDDPNSLSFDIGVDCHNYVPLNVEQINQIMLKKTWKPVDHHGAKKISP
jgi:calcineurin-like phosphoesterase family protein